VHGGYDDDIHVEGHNDELTKEELADYMIAAWAKLKA
jgi:hypothetical protein